MLSTFQRNEKYVYPSVAKAELQKLYNQLFELIGTLDDSETIIERNRALLCFGEVAELIHRLSTTFADFDTYCYRQWQEVYVMVHKAKRVLNQHGNA